MRGLAALYVAVGHIFTMVDPHMKLRRPGAQPEWLANLAAPFWYGHLAVASFIVISGFCLQWALEVRSDGRFHDFRRYIVRRCRRILPPYYACLALSLIVCWAVTSRQTGLPWAQYVPVTSENVLAHLFMVHNFSPDWMYKINGVLWSIAIEFQIYFAFPVFVWIMLRFRPVGLWLSLAAGAALLMTVVPNGAKLYFWYAPLFGLGMGFAHLTIRRWVGAWPLGLLSGLGLGVSVWAASSLKGQMILADAGIGLFTACLMAGLVSVPRSPESQTLSWRPVLFLGTMSYSLYLVHHPLMQVFHAHRPDWAASPVRQVAFLMACLPIILGLCWIFHLVFEKPFLGRKS